MSAFWNALKVELQSRVPFFLWAILSLLLISTGPFGTYAAFGVGQRMLFWLPVLAGAILFGLVLLVVVERQMPGLDARATTLVSTVGACVLLGPLLYLLIGLIAPPGSPNHPGFAEILVVVASLSLSLSALRIASYAGPKARLAPVVVSAADQPVARLLQRIDPSGRGDLLAISVRDHYVDVLTSLGETSLLMRLADAIAEADAVEGAQVHRSHWVAWSAVAAVEREGGRLFLRLVHGKRVPVSKTHSSKLQDRGLI
jgi:hypothetical protein